MKWMTIVICLFLAIGLALTVEQPLINTYDVKILMFFEDIRTASFNELFYFFTEIGSIKFLLLLAIIVTVFLLMKKCYLESFFVMFTFWGVRGANYMLKEWFERERPSFNALIEVGDYSFPSGHTMNSIAFIGFLLYLFVRILKVGIKHRLLWLFLTLIIVILIAVSRVYLGVHYLTDVVAGACYGVLYLFLIIYLYQFASALIQKNGT
ncbi:phosphatase PAP2 family protein [Lederbergia lenta]|uniref:Phosphoesterase PA-phosphatase related n=1 Tax=Lederbergia lenta TaxID=1467 RepID=A0A2X4WEB5_LEDLE|nr:phosphatase PAP2 family protein [Lederbergia lenta]MEC2324849.1 phosphatase PAP2 family protein [Lederbergia lenta]SQI57172.1 phosphoesterase PA-phosphatase related [Lederbergia lenta]